MRRAETCLEVLNQVDTTGRVYFTRNGHCEYGILAIEQIDELDRYRAAYLLHSKLQKAEERAAEEGWIEMGCFIKRNPK